MGLTVSDQGNYKPIPLMPADTYTGVCRGYADLGTHMESFQGGDPKPKHKCMLFFEFPSERLEFDDGRNEPRNLSKRYNSLSLGEKATLRKELDAWRGRPFTQEELKGFDLDRLVGVGAMVGVTIDVKQDGREYNSISALVKVPKGIPVPQLEGPPIRYQIHSDTGEFIVPPEEVPAWVQRIIGESEEAKAAGWTAPQKGEQQKPQAHAPQAAPQAAPELPPVDDTPF